MKNRWIFWLLVIVFVWIVISRFTEVQKLVKTLESGQWQWVLAAALLQVIYYLIYTGLYQSAFDTVEVRSRLIELLPVTFASLFLNVAAPSGGASGAALFVDDASRRGESAARATVGTLLVLIADFSAFLLILVAGIVYLITQHDLKLYEIAGALILLVIIACLGALLLLGLWRPDWLNRFLSWLRRLLNRLAARLKRPGFLEEDWADKTATDFSEAAIAVASHPGRLERTISVALAAHLVDLASLFCLFLAFQQRVYLGQLVAGYAMGVLFWIVTITPQGIGVVEGVMTLVFASLGIPIERATIISLSFRGLTFWLPLAIGFFMLRRMKAFEPGKKTSNEALSVHLVAVLTGLMGLINLLSAVTPSLRDRLRLLEQYSPLAVARGGHLAAALAGFFLLILSANLWRRKRVAWMLTEVTLVISVVSHLFKGLDYEEALLSSALAGWLFYLRPHFHARSDPPSIRQGIGTLGAALGFSLLYGTAGFYLLDRHFQVHFGLGSALVQTVLMFVEFQNPGILPVTRFGNYFINSVYIISAVTLTYALWMLVRPVLDRGAATVQERGRATHIVQQWGHSSLARLTLLDDKRYFFSPGGSVIAYIVKGRIALTLGDPIGPPEDFVACLSGYAAFCAANDWLPSYYQVKPDHLPDYENAGYDSLCIGQEGIVTLGTFSLAGGENKSIRSSYNKISRLGYSFEVLDPPIPAERMRELRQISDEWLTNMHGSEKRFSLGWFDEAYLNSGPIALVCNPNGRIDAFGNINHEYQANEVTLDLMRHRHESEKGQMDFLFVSLFQWAAGKGYASFNLGLSAFFGIGEKPQDPVIERALHYIYEHVDQFYNFKGLHEFKDKFHPAWSPRYLIYPGPTSLLSVALAMIRADAGEEHIWQGYLGKPGHPRQPLKIPAS